MPRSYAFDVRRQVIELAGRVAAVCLVAGALASTASGVAAAAPQTVPAGTFSGCPHSVLPLPGPLATYAPAVRTTVLRFVATAFAHRSKNPKQLVGARASGVTFVRDWLPSGWIKDECGKTVWQRSVAVGVYFPAMDLLHNPVGRCNDCDHITFITARSPTGWMVWGEY